MALPDGGHLVLWSGDWDPGAGIFGQIFAADGSSVSGTIHVNNDFPGGMSGNQVAPAAAVLPGGGFVVTWLTAYDGWPPGIQARIFDAAGAAQTHVFSVSAPALATIRAFRRWRMAVSWWSGRNPAPMAATS
ncbi:MAG: hypothetical protein HZT43_06055 [Exiguobacterium profundum]|nr:MAG: hypothetical protein HZT43_06055 [Exiguobacterium profundum]